MNWNEDWLKANRPPASEHPKKYTFIPSGPGKVVFFYFVTIIVLDYLALTFLGGRPVVILGLPLLIWITVVFAALTIAGILFFSARNNDNSSQPVETPPSQDE